MITNEALFPNVQAESEHLKLDVALDLLCNNWLSNSNNNGYFQQPWFQAVVQHGDNFSYLKNALCQTIFSLKVHFSYNPNKRIKLPKPLKIMCLRLDFSSEGLKPSVGLGIRDSKRSHFWHSLVMWNKRIH